MARRIEFPPPRILVDTREQRPLVFTRLPSRVATLRTGDYSAEGMETEFCVERKSIDDLVGSVTADRPRFFRELERMAAFRFRRLLVCGPRSAVLMKRYHAQHVSPRAVMAAVAVIETRHLVPVAWAVDPREAAAMVEEWAHYLARDKAKAAAGASGTVRAPAHARDCEDRESGA